MLVKLHQNRTFTPTSKQLLRKLLKHHHIELGFDQVRVYTGQNGTQLFAHGRLRILAEDHIEQEGRIIKKPDYLHLYDFAIPPFTYCKEHNQPTIEVSHHLLPNSHRPMLSTVSGHTPFSMRRVLLYHLKEHTKEYDISKAALQSRYLLDPTLELPDEPTYTVTHHVDLLSYIVLEHKDGEHTIIEVLNAPESYAFHFNDSALISDIDTRVNEDTGELLYRKEVLE
jgi:hypothetical protein